jgi:hypothetical protein
MWYRHFRRFSNSAAILGLAIGISLSAQDSGHRGRKYKAPPPTSRIDVTILRNDDGRPIENAAVVFQLVGEKGNMELKTNEDGKTMIDVLPTGSKMTLQVIAKGFQTYGADYAIDKSQMSLEIKMKRPGQQYSIYKDHSQEANSSKDAPTGQTPDKSAGVKQDADKDQQSESARQSDAKPETSQPQPQ